MLLANFLNNVAAAFNLTVMGLVLVAVASSTNEASSEQSLVASAGVAGAVSGQLVLGILGDCVGRFRALGLTTVFIMVGSFLSAFLPQGENILFTLAGCRFITGFGVGGVYPLTAVASVEEKGNKGVSSTLLVFSGQGWGQLLAPFTVYILAAMKLSDQTIWRATLAIGAAPSVLALIFMLRDARRRRLEAEFDAIGAIINIAGEHPANVELRREQEMLAQQDLGAVNNDKQSFRRTFCNWNNMKKLIGTGGTWFMFDMTFYANVIFAPIMLERVFGLSPGSGVSEIAGPTSIALLVGLPGYYIALGVVRRTGLKRLQIFGFAVLAVLYGVLAVTLDVLPPGVLFAVYAATFFFSNLGPNSTTFCLPSKTFPKSSRSTFNGISAAFGKLGAVVGTAMFPPILNAGGTAAALGSSAIIALVGAVLTYFTIESEFISQAPRSRRVGNSTFVGFVEMGPQPNNLFENMDTEMTTTPSPKRLPFSSQNNNFATLNRNNPFAISHSSYEMVGEDSYAIEQA